MDYDKIYKKLESLLIVMCNSTDVSDDDLYYIKNILITSNRKAHKVKDVDLIKANYLFEKYSIRPYFKHDIDSNLLNEIRYNGKQFASEMFDLTPHVFSVIMCNDYLSTFVKYTPQSTFSFQNSLGNIITYDCERYCLDIRSLYGWNGDNLDPNIISYLVNFILKDIAGVLNQCTEIFLHKVSTKYGSISYNPNANSCMYKMIIELKKIIRTF
jgi:hypothetical protein